MVIGTLFCHVGGELCHLHLCSEIPLKARVHHLTLRRFESIGHGGDGAFQIREAEIDQVFVHEIRDVQLFDVAVRNL